MSHPAINWAMRQRGLKPATKIVLLVLADRYNPAFGCFPDQATIAEDAEMSRASVNVHLDILEERGLISRATSVDNATKRQRPTEYILNFDKDGPVSRNRTRKAPAESAAVSEIQTRTQNDQTQDVVVPPEAAVSRNRTRDEAGAVSSFPQKPCPDFCESRVQNLDTNLVRVNPVREPVSGGGERARESDDDRPDVDLYRKVLHLVGLNEADILPPKWMAPRGLVEVGSWLRIAPGILTAERILEFVAAEQRRKGYATPNGPKAFERGLTDFAAALAAPTPSPGTPRAEPNRPNPTLSLEAARAALRNGRTA